MADAIALAQEQLGKTLERARVEEDRELATRVRELGAQLAHLLNGLLHMARTHALNNTAFDTPVGEFASSLRALMELLGPVSLQCVEEHVYVNDIRIRFDRLIEKSITLGDSLAGHGTGGLTFNAPLSDPEVRTVVRLLSTPPSAAQPRTELQSTLAGEGVGSLQVHPPFRFRITGEEMHKATHDFRDVYQAGSGTVADLFASLAADRLPSPLPVRRLVQDLIDASRDRDVAAEAMVTDADVPPFAQHTLMVTNLALLLGRAAGLTDTSLADLGVAAMFHDVGLCTQNNAFEVAYQRHTRAGLRVLVRQRGFHRAKLRRLLTVLQHHRSLDDAGGAPALYARIVHIADDYDILTRPRQGQGPILSTPDCIARMAAQAGKAYDPLLIQLFCNVMGRFPPGAILNLEDGHTVLSVSTVRSADTFDKPLCRVVRRPDGSTPEAEELLDLADGGRVVKVHHPRA